MTTPSDLRSALLICSDPLGGWSNFCLILCCLLHQMCVHVWWFTTDSTIILVAIPSSNCCAGSLLITSPLCMVDGARRRGAKLVSSLVSPLSAAFHCSATNFDFVICRILATLTLNILRGVGAGSAIYLLHDDIFCPSHTSLSSLSELAGPPPRRLKIVVHPPQSSLS